MSDKVAKGLQMIEEEKENPQKPVQPFKVSPKRIQPTITGQITVKNHTFKLKDLVEFTKVDTKNEKVRVRFFYDYYKMLDNSKRRSYIYHRKNPKPLQSYLHFESLFKVKGVSLLLSDSPDGSNPKIIEMKEDPIVDPQSIEDDNMSMMSMAVKETEVEEQPSHKWKSAKCELNRLQTYSIAFQLHLENEHFKNYYTPFGEPEFTEDHV